MWSCVEMRPLRVHGHVPEEEDVQCLHCSGKGVKGDLLAGRGDRGGGDRGLGQKR